MIKSIFQEKQPFIGFVTGGDGGIDYCVECCLQLIGGGVDILEIGFPFSDPTADGPVIQQSSQRALARQTNATTLLEIAKRLRQHTDIPLVLFSYFNPLLNAGETFLFEAKNAGYDAILIIDLPPFIHNDPLHPYYQKIMNANLIPIFVVTPSTDDIRMQKIATISSGFIYYACQKGTTGMQEQLPDDLVFHLNRLKRVSRTPIVVGFGIANISHAKMVLEHADGFVVGSAFVSMMALNTQPDNLKRCAQSIDPR